MKYIGKYLSVEKRLTHECKINIFCNDFTTNYYLIFVIMDLYAIISRKKVITWLSKNCDKLLFHYELKSFMDFNLNILKKSQSE